MVMCEAFKNPQGIAVDTHVFRIAHRLGFVTRNDDTPAKTEAKLLKIYPQSDWLYINHQWVHFRTRVLPRAEPAVRRVPREQPLPLVRGKHDDTARQNRTPGARRLGSPTPAKTSSASTTRARSATPPVKNGVAA